MFSPGHSRHGITLLTLVGCELSYGLLLVVEARLGDYSGQREKSPKRFVIQA